MQCGDLEGKKNAEIAERLNVSPETVHTLKKVAYKKLRAFPYRLLLLPSVYLSKSIIFFYFFKKKSLSIHHVFILACIIIKDRLKHAKL